MSLRWWNELEGTQHNTTQRVRSATRTCQLRGGGGRGLLLRLWYNNQQQWQRRDFTATIIIIIRHKKYRVVLCHYVCHCVQFVIPRRISFFLWIYVRKIYTTGIKNVEFIFQPYRWKMDSTIKPQFKFLFYDFNPARHVSSLCFLCKGNFY